MNCIDTRLSSRELKLRFAKRFAMRTAVLATAVTLSNAALTAGANPENSRQLHQIGEGRTMVIVQPNDAWQPDGFPESPILHAAPVASGPAIDGNLIDQAWNRAIELAVPLAWGNVREATLKAVYTKEDIFIAVSWPDPTPDEQHHPWAWDAVQNLYVEGPQVEDSLIVSIEGGCDWNASLLANQIYDFDAWVWLAARTNPLGQAVDADGSVQNRWIPDKGYVKYQSRYPDPTWNVKFTDRGDDILTRSWQELERMYKLVPPEADVFVRYVPDGSSWSAVTNRVAPPTEPIRTLSVGLGPSASEHDQITVPQYQPVRLTGNAGEVAAKGRWMDGRWTVELRRARVTQAQTSSDSIFARTTQFSIHVFDRADRLDEASESGRLFLQFDRPRPGEETDRTTLVSR